MFDMNDEMKSKIEDEILKTLAKEIADEIDNQILSDLYDAAGMDEVDRLDFSEFLKETDGDIDRAAKAYHEAFTKERERVVRYRGKTEIDAGIMNAPYVPFK